MARFHVVQKTLCLISYGNLLIGSTIGELLNLMMFPMVGGVLLLYILLGNIPNTVIIMNNIDVSDQTLANTIARKAGHGRATKIVYGNFTRKVWIPENYY